MVVGQSSLPNQYYYTVLGIAYRLEGRYKESIKIAKKYLVGTPDNLQALLILAACYRSLDNTVEAEKTSKQILRVNPNFLTENYVMTLPYKNQDVANRYIDVLRKAGLPG